MACGTGHRAELLLHLCEPVDRLDVVFILKVSLEPGTLAQPPVWSLASPEPEEQVRSRPLAMGL